VRSFFGRCLLVAIGIVACAGCRLDANVLVKTARDGSGSVTVTAVADKDMIGRAGLALADLRLDDVKQAGWTVEGPSDAAGGGRQVVFGKSFRTQAEADRILAELSGPAGPFHDVHLVQKRGFAKITTTLQGQIGLDGGVAGLGDDELVQLLGGQQVLQGLTGTNIADQLLVSVTLKAPGAAAGPSAGTGPMDGATRTPLSLKSVETDHAAVRARTIAYASIALAVVIAVLAVSLMNRRRRAAQRRQLVWRR
jgi:hypothetical protein